MPPVPTLDFPPNFTISRSLGMNVYNTRLSSSSDFGGFLYTPSMSDIMIARSALISTDILAASESLSVMGILPIGLNINSISRVVNSLKL